MLRVEPCGANTENCPAVRDHVERGHRLRQQRRIAVGHTGHQRAEASRFRPGRERSEQRVRPEHLQLGGADERQLEEMVHHENGVEPGFLAGDGDGRDLLEQRLVTRRVGEVRNL